VVSTFNRTNSRLFNLTESALPSIRLARAALSLSPLRDLALRDVINNAPGLSPARSLPKRNYIPASETAGRGRGETRN